jgi:hypothetical protein
MAHETEGNYKKLIRNCSDVYMELTKVFQLLSSKRYRRSERNKSLTQKEHLGAQII